MRKLKASTKLSFLVVVLCCFIIGMGAYGIRELKIMNQNTETLYADRLIPLELLTTIRYSYAKVILSAAMEANSHQLIVTQALQQIQEAEKNIHVNWEAYKLTYLTADETKLIKQAEPLMLRGNSIINKLKDALNKNDGPEINVIVNKEINNEMNSIVSKLNELVQLQVTVSEELNKSNKEVYSSTTTKFYISIAAALIFALALSFLILGDTRHLIKDLEASNRKIAASEEKFRAFIENAGDAILIFDQEFRIIEVNNYACIMSGYSREELTSMKTSDLIPSQEFEDHSRGIEILINRGGSLHERKLLRKDGSLIETEVNVTSLKGRGSIAIIRDVTEIRNTQRQVTLSESTLRSAFDHSAIGMALVSTGGKFLKTNIELSKMTGYSTDELLSMKFRDITLPEDIGQDLVMVQKAVKGEIDNFNLEKRYVRKDGSIIWVKLNSSLVKDSRDLPIFFVTQIEDITETKRLSGQLAEKEFQYTLLFNHALEYIAVFDNEGYIVDVNESLCKLTGLKKEDLLNMKAEELIEPENLKNTPIDYEVKPVGSVMITERKIRKSSGGFADVEVSRKQIDGNRIMTIGRDITERNLIAQQLKESELKFRGLVENSMVGVYIIQDGKFAYVNPKFAEIFGYKPEELINTFTTTQLVDQESVEFVRSSIRAKIEGEIDSNYYEAKGIKKDGQKIWMEIYSSSTLFQGNKAIIGSILDITERKNSEAEIIKLSRLNQLKSSINELMLKSSDKEEIYRETCRIAVEFGKFRMAWVGFYNKEEYHVVPFTSSGQEDGYLQDVLLLKSNRKITARGPIEKSIHSKKVAHCNDIANDPNVQAWRDEALKRSFGSCVSLPIIVENKIEAFIILYMQDAFFFNEAEIQLLQNITDNIAYGLDKIRVDALQKKSEEELTESEGKFRTLVEQSLVGVFIFQKEKFIYTNPGFEKISGYTGEELMNGMSFKDLIHEDDLDLIQTNYFGRISGQKITDHYNIRAIRADGALRHIEIIVSAIIYKGSMAIIGTVIDITSKIEEKKRIEKAIIDIQERERLQIGMELHDNVNQILAASSINLDVLKRNLDDRNRADEIISDLKSYTIEAINELRRLSHQLAPSIDAEIPLADKIVSLANKINIAKKLDIFIDVDTFENDFSSSLQLTFYRIIQEQLTNILKYAEASFVEISIHANDQNVRLKIVDNGKGFDTDKKKEGIGLENIRRRVGMFDGKVEILSSSGKGCTIIVLIPFNKSL